MPQCPYASHGLETPSRPPPNPPIYSYHIAAMVNVAPIAPIHHSLHPYSLDGVYQIGDV